MQNNSLTHEKLYQLIEKLSSAKTLSFQEFCTLIDNRNSTFVAEELKTRAQKISQSIFSNKIFVRELIEFTNYCKNNCYYCGIRCANKNVQRYRLSKEEILDCADKGYELGFRTIVLQGGEDFSYSAEDMAEIVKSIKQKHPDTAVTLSVGERPLETYALWKKAGADRYLLRHETANDEHYRLLHPKELSPQTRKQCLWNLKSLGYQTGAGFMVGSPFQTTQHYAEDLLFLRDLNPEMIGIGPFIHHSETPFASMNDGSCSDTLFFLSILRIMFPAALIPATTALGTIQKDGREQGILCGANVIMPNLSPLTHRKDYLLYNNKISTDQDGAESLELLKQKVKSIGYEIVTDRGDFPYKYFKGEIK